MHKFWRLAFWGLKYIDAKVDPNDTTMTDIELQFHWMPRCSSASPMASFPLRKAAEFPSALKHVYGNEPYDCPERNTCDTCKSTLGVMGRHVSSGYPLRTGDIFTIRRSTEDVYLVHEMIELQWACIRAAATSGAALVPDQLGDVES